MNSTFLFSAALISASLFGVDFDRIKPHEPTQYSDPSGATYVQSDRPDQSPSNDSLIISELKGVVITDSTDNVTPEELERAVGSAEAINIQVPGSIKSFQALMRSQFLNRPLTMHRLIQLKQETIEYYRRWGHPIVTVEIPEQNLSSGVLQLVVIEAKLGNVSVEGNKFFKSENYTGNVRLKQGDPINAKTLVMDLNWINRNPFRHVDAVYAPGSVPHTTDIRLLAKDRRPWRVFAGVDNTGFEETENTRIFLGANWGNVFDTDQMASVQVTAAPNVDRYWAISADYTIPLPWRDVWAFYGGYSHVHGNMKEKDMKDSGYAAQASTRYNFILKNDLSYLKDITVGFDYKRTNSNLEYGGTQVFRNSINLTQLMAGITLGYDSEFIKSSFTLEGFYSPGEWLPEQSNSDYQKVRYMAKSNYFYARMAFAPIIRLPEDFSFALTLRGQLASHNLLASEQYGLGGYSTVRGYNERVFNVDNAFLASTELRSPSLKMLNRKYYSDLIQFLVFLDYALGRDVHPIPGNPVTRYLLGVGPGVRYEVTPYLSFRGDLGFQLKHEGNRHLRFHFSLVGSY